MTSGPAGGSRLQTELDRHWLNWTLVAWLATCIFFIWWRQGQIQWLALGDTDDNMRLMQVRALLAGQGWYDLTNYRLDPALGGYNIHWSRLVDLPIAGLILLFKPFIGMAAAEKWACGIAPLLPLALTMTAISVTTRRLIDPRAWPVALVILLFSCTSTMSMYAPERIGLEMLPYCAMAAAIIGLRWVWDADEARRMQVYGVTLAGVSALGFALFASNANQAMRCDALTPVWLSTVMTGGVLLFLLSLTKPQNLWVRLLLAVVAGTAIATGFALLFPQCLGRPEGVSPELERIWLNNVREARPIYRHALDSVIPIAALPIIGVIGAIIATWRARATPQAVGWAAIALFTAFAGAMLLWQIRAGPAAQLLGVPGSAALIWLVVGWCIANKRMMVRVIGSAAAAVILSGIFVVYLLPYLPKEKADPGASRSNRSSASCNRLPSMRMLDTIPAATMFTHVDMGPRLIVLTHHNAIAGPYHRNERAILDVHHAFMGTPAQFRPIAKAHGAEYVLTCPNMAETTLYKARSRNGFYAQLDRGQVPKWLVPVELPAGAPYKLWKIDYAAPDDPVSAPPRPKRP